MSARANIGFLAVAALAAGCTSDARCPAPAGGNEPTFSIGASGQSFSYEDFTSSANNDCPAGGTTVVSVTVGATQVGSGFPLTLCLPRPDLLGAAPVSLADTTRVQIVDVSARDPQNCTYRWDATVAPVGTVTFDGFCEDSGHIYDVVFAGQVAGQKICDVLPLPVTLDLSGRAPVAAQ